MGNDLGGLQRVETWNSYCAPPIHEKRSLVCPSLGHSTQVPRAERIPLSNHSGGIVGINRTECEGTS